MVCEEYLKGNQTKEAIKIKYGIKGSTSLLFFMYWKIMIIMRIIMIGTNMYNILYIYKKKNY